MKYIANFYRDNGKQRETEYYTDVKCEFEAINDKRAVELALTYAGIQRYKKGSEAGMITVSFSLKSLQRLEKIKNQELLTNISFEVKKVEIKNLEDILKAAKFRWI